VLASPLVETTPPQVVLRDVDDRDLDVLFEHATDREAIWMAASPQRIPTTVTPSTHAGQG
jgi:hypothetical protein